MEVDGMEGDGVVLVTDVGLSMGFQDFALKVFADGLGLDV